jgi:hypothetical protein
MEETARVRLPENARSRHGHRDLGSGSENLKHVKVRTVQGARAMKAIWKGAISFGLFNIPIALGTAVPEEGPKFRMLHGKDMSPINFKRVAEVDSKEVPYFQIVKGYEAQDQLG